MTIEVAHQQDRILQHHPGLPAKVMDGNRLRCHTRQVDLPSSAESQDLMGHGQFFLTARLLLPRHTALCAVVATKKDALLDEYFTICASLELSDPS